MRPVRCRQPMVRADHAPQAQLARHPRRSPAPFSRTPLLIGFCPSGESKDDNADSSPVDVHLASMPVLGGARRSLLAESDNPGARPARATESPDQMS